MKIREMTVRPLATAIAAVGVAGAAWYAATTGAEDPSKPPTSRESPVTAALQPDSDAAGLAANLYFTDEHGNPRTPTAAEMRILADALKRDLARMTGPHRGKHYERTLPGGGVAATVATSELVFLTAVENGDGTVTVGHSGIADDIVVGPETTATAPEM